jgi:hypothetical protein
MTPSRDSDIGPDEEPLVGDGGSADELGWEAPTRPDRPLKLPRPQPVGGSEPSQGSDEIKTDDNN